MRALYLACAAFLLAASVADAKPIVTVAQDGSGDFNGKDEQPLMAALAQVQQGGGEVWIYPGTYVVQQALVLKGARNILVRGIGRVELKLRPVQYAQVKTAVAVGATELEVSVQQGMAAGMRLQIMADGPVEPLTGKPRPTFVTKLAKIEGTRLVVAEPLAYPVPAGTRIMNEDAPNLWDLRGSCADITLERLTLDGGRTAADPEIPAHAQRCAVFASGPYNYTAGLIGEPFRGLRVRECVVRNCFGRGLALYAVHDAEISNCTVSDTLDEAIDLDHFTVNARVVGNRLQRARVGVELNDANDCTVQGNIIEACGQGVKMWRWCKMPELNVRNRVLDNTLLNTQGVAVQFEKETGLAYVRDNVIRGAKRSGLVLSGSGALVERNVMEGVAEPAVVVEGVGNFLRHNEVHSGTSTGQGKAPIMLGGRANTAVENTVWRAGEMVKPGEVLRNTGAGNVVAGSPE